MTEQEMRAQAEALLTLADYIDASRTWERTKHGSPEAHEAQQEMWRLHKDLTDMGPIALRAQARQVVELAGEVQRLREALESIEVGEDFARQTGQLNRQVAAMAELARSALATQEAQP